jgi:hypothetical protein
VTASGRPVWQSVLFWYLRRLSISIPHSIEFSSEGTPLGPGISGFVSHYRCSCSYGPTGSLSAESKIAQPFGPSRKSGRSRPRATAAAPYAGCRHDSRQASPGMLCVASGRAWPRRVGLLRAWPPTSPTAVDHWRRSRFEQGRARPCKSIMGASRSRSPRTLPRSFRQHKP